MRRFPWLLVLAIVSPSEEALAAGDALSGTSEQDPRVRQILDDVSADRIRRRIETLAGFGTRHTLSDPEQTDRGIGAARRWIEKELNAIAERSGGRLQVELDSYVQEPARRIDKPTEIVNIVATLPGTQPESAERWIVVGGHYDSINGDVMDREADAPGANDDASGTAVVLELAEVMASHEFDATIVLVAFAGEEQGLYGSTHFAAQAREEQKQIEAMLTNDIVGNTEGSNGRRDNRSVRIFSEGLPALDTRLAASLRSVGGESDSPSRQLARFIDESTELYLPHFDARLVFRADRYLRGGDHMPFLAEGYPAIRLTEPAEAYERQHKYVRTEDGKDYGDVPERVDFAYVANVARVNAAAVATLALAPPPPEEAAVLTRRLEAGTTLRWEPVNVPDLAGYEVVWRDTTEPTWTHARFVGKDTEVTLPELSKDDFHFGVRSVDQSGHRSPVAFPLPRRN